MERPQSNKPFKDLGKQLQKMRSKRQESLAEVSGAVEIDIDDLSSFEAGKHRPTEDILLLLISHFAVKEDEATKLWELAGYDQQAIPMSQATNDQTDSSNVVVMPNDARIVYTDMVHVMVNNYGVVMNFMQGAGPSNKALAIARIGMSKEHARSVLEVLQKTLALDDPKTLPAPDNKADKSKK